MQISSGMKNFEYEGESYQIDSSRPVDNCGDIDPAKKTVYVDKNVAEKFHEGIVVHEIEERKLLQKGHSYVYSHNEAQKKELEFYEKKYGKDNGLSVLREEESMILSVFRRNSSPKLRKSKILKVEEDDEGKELSQPAPLPIEMRNIWEISFEGKRYIIDHTEKLIGTLVDVYERGHVIYIDRDVPERFFEGLSLHELVTRKFLRKGYSWSNASNEGESAEKEYYTGKYGAVEAGELFNDELKFQAWKFDQEKKELKFEEGGHKVIYEKGEILPK